MTMSFLENWNQSAFLAINAGAQASALAIALAKLLATWPIYLAPVLLIFAWIRRGKVIRFALLDATLAAVIGLGVAQAITAIWYHPRPFEIGLGHQLLDHAPEASFPSDHATLLFSLTIPLLFCTEARRWGAVLLALGIAVSWSRIYLGVHFPLDMIGAFGVAIIASLVIVMAGPHLRRRAYPLLISIYETLLRRIRLPQAVFPRDLYDN
ncbi:MAG: undecaprenyl-diphosphatase [Cypionkella sp.]